MIGRFFRQFKVYVNKNSRIFVNEKRWLLFVFSFVISIVICMVVSDKMFSTYESTKSGFFALVSAFIWIGIFNSIQSVCKEQDTIRYEYRSGLNLGAFIAAHIVFDFFICLVQALIAAALFVCFVDFPEEGIVFDNAVTEYLITFFLIIWCSDILGLMISSMSANPTKAMTYMPFVLIIQLIMSGVLFELSGASETIAQITFSKWGMSALGSIADLNSDTLPLRLVQEMKLPQVPPRTIEEMYEHIPENLFSAWGAIAVIGAVCGIISIIVLKARNRKM